MRPRFCLELASLIVFTVHQRFLNFHGEIHARLNRDQSVFQKTKRTWFMDLVSPLLLYAPETYLRNVQSLAVDGLVDKPSWNKLTSELTEEWKENTLYVSTKHLHDSGPFLTMNFGYYTRPPCC